MSKTKHTPGEWKKTQAYNNGEPECWTVRVGATAICDVPQDKEADADLIAAAPDLLAASVSASESLKHFVATNLWPSGVCAADVYSILKEAEVKAGGKS